MNPFTIVTYGLGDTENKCCPDTTSIFTLGFSTFDFSQRTGPVDLTFDLSVNRQEDFGLIR